MIDILICDSSSRSSAVMNGTDGWCATQNSTYDENNMYDWHVYHRIQTMIKVDTETNVCMLDIAAIVSRHLVAMLM